MKSIVRRDSDEDWEQYVTRLMKEEGVIEKDDEEVRRFDKKRKNKKVSNDDWVSHTDPEARITKMKDGLTHLAYKSEHVIDAETELILAAEVYESDHSDTQTLTDRTTEAVENAKRAGSERKIEEVVADKGYHSAKQFELIQSLNFRTYIPELQRKGKSRWSDKPPEHQRGVNANRRRIKTEKNKRL